MPSCSKDEKHPRQQDRTRSYQPPPPPPPPPPPDDPPLPPDREPGGEDAEAMLDDIAPRLEASPVIPPAAERPPPYQPGR